MKDDRHIRNLMDRIPWLVVGAVILTIIVVFLEILLRKTYG